jgi:uncharacterized protein YcgI (DUF1989 family)
VGWHDPLSGCANAALVASKYGVATYQECRNEWHQNAYDGFVVELTKYGLNARDMAAPINFFSKVTVDESGAMTFVPGHSRPGMSIELRAEMNVLVFLNSGQHPLDPHPEYSPKPVRLSVWRVAAPEAHDECRTSCAENGRGFILTERYFQ